MLVGAAGIGATISATGGGYLHLAAVVLFLVGAVFGIRTLWPRRGIGVDLDPLFDDLYVNDRREMELILLQVKLKALREDETALLRESGSASRGFALLGVAILMLALHAGASMVAIGSFNLGGVL